MRLVIDIGNTNIVLGVYQEGVQLNHYRLPTVPNPDGKQCRQFIVDCLNDLNIDRKQLKNSILASVVFPLKNTFQRVLLELTGKECYLVDSKNIPNLMVDVEFPDKVGIDRLINVYAGFELFQCAMIVIDLGTATTFDVISEERTFLGGAIAPGLKLSRDALVSHTDQLPEITLEAPKSVIGKNTIECMQSGVLFGYAGMVDSMAGKMIKELKKPQKVIATGGLAKVIQPLSDTIELVIDDLTLKGLDLIANYHDKS